MESQTIFGQEAKIEREREKRRKRDGERERQKKCNPIGSWHLCVFFAADPSTAKERAKEKKCPTSNGKISG